MDMKKKQSDSSKENQSEVYSDKSLEDLLKKNAWMEAEEKKALMSLLETHTSMLVKLRDDVDKLLEKND